MMISMISLRYTVACVVLSLLAMLMTGFTQNSYVYAEDVTCTSNMTDMNFGEVDFINSSTTKTTNGTLKYNCINHTVVAQYLHLCFYLDNDATSLPSSAAWYQMRGDAGASMTVQFQDVASREVWGGLASQLPISVMASMAGNGTLNGNISIRGMLADNQTQLKFGNYSTVFSMGTRLSWSNSPMVMPDLCTDHIRNQAFGFTSLAVVKKSCAVSAQDMDFGRVTLQPGKNIDAVSEIRVRCTSDAEYTVSLRSINARDGQFHMVLTNGDGSIKDQIPYTLYQDPGRTLPWGDADKQKLDRGSGGEQRHGVYGRVVAQDISVPSGLYQDTVIVRLSY